MFRTFIASSSEGLRYAEAIKAGLSQSPVLHVTGWWEAANWTIGKSTFENLDMIIRSHTDLVVIIATQDDKAEIRGQATIQARDNVILECGLATGVLGRSRVMLIRIGTVDLPADLAGISYESAQPQMAGESDSQCTQRFVSLARDLPLKLLAGENASDSLMRDVRDHISAIEPEDRLRFLASLRKQRFSKSPKGSNLQRAAVLLTHLSDSGIHDLGATQSQNIKGYLNILAAGPAQQAELVGYLSQPLDQALRRSGGGNLPIRIALHYKEDPRELYLSCRVISYLQERPLLISLQGRLFRPEMYGSSIRGETVIFFQDFTVSGDTPLICIVALQRAGFNVKDFMTLVVEKSHLAELRRNCRRANVRLTYFLVRDGSKVTAVSTAR